MAFSPARVIGRLLSSFTPDFSIPTRKEIAIADAFRGILQGAEYGDVDYEEEEESLQASFDEKEEVCWTPDDDDDDRNSADIPPRKTVFFDGRPIPQDTIKRAIDHYRDTDKGTRFLASMANRFKWIKTERHINMLRETEKRGMVGESRVLNFKRLSALVRERALEAAEQGLPLSYAIVRHMVVRLNREHGLIEDFKASKSWIAKFTEGRAGGKRFREKRQGRDEKFPLSAFANADQTGINKELASGRTLAPVGSKQVMRVVQSVSSLTHSFTAMPVRYADGRLGDKLLVVLPERGGVFPQMGHWEAPNLLVMAGKTHIMANTQVPAFVKECVVGTSSPPVTILLVDSWAGFADHTNVLSEVPEGKELRLMTIPPGATALCQPLDVYFFRLFKRYIRRIHDHVMHHHPEFAFSRDNVLKVVSQTYRQFCAPVFRPCLAYAWVAAGYVDDHPGPFSTPTDYGFNGGEVVGACQGATNCPSLAFVKCSWYGRQLCFTCFIELYHIC